MKTVRLKGEAPWAAKGLTGTSRLIGLVCRAEFEDGELVTLDFSDVEYYYFRSTTPGGTRTEAWASRLSSDKDKYPNWPNAEPEV